MSNRLYVGNLDYKVTNEDLAQYFAGAGTVASAVVISDRQSDRSKGFGFVEMSTPEEGSKAVEMFHGKEFMGRPLVVNEARPREEQPAR